MPTGVGRWAALAFACNLHGTALGAQGPLHEFREVHLGMEMRLVIDAPAARARAGAEAAFLEVARLEGLLSDWRAGSELRRLTEHPAGTWVPLSDPLFAVLARAIALASASDGAFDPTIGVLTARWREVRDGAPPPSTAELRALRSRVGWHHLTLDRETRRLAVDRDGMRFDLGGIAKGWILDRALERLRAYGIGRALVEAGGDIVVGAAPRGMTGWRISVPRAGGDTVLVVAEAAIASSGAEAQALDIDGSRRSHVIDPRRGFGLTDRRAATVVARDGATADGLATALTLMPIDRGRVLAASYGARIVRLDP